MSPNTSKEATNYFKKQYPDGKQSETYTVESYEERLTDFTKCNLDFGWVLGKATNGKDKGDITRFKSCLGAVYCETNLALCTKKQ